MNIAMIAIGLDIQLILNPILIFNLTFFNKIMKPPRNFALEQMKDNEDQEFNRWASNEGREEYEAMTNECDPRDCYN